MHVGCGLQDPVGFWDPAGFAADGNKENFARRRQAELKHGRIAMLATMGRLAFIRSVFFVVLLLLFPIAPLSEAFVAVAALLGIGVRPFLLYGASLQQNLL